MSGPDPDDDAWQDEANFGERPELPTFDPEEIEAAIWRLRMENHL
jgi:hypothetical protein